MAGNGGRGRGMPRLPSIELSKAVSSPQTNAPAPSRKCARKLKSVPKNMIAKETDGFHIFDRAE
jgi:hypothetical protein